MRGDMLKEQLLFLVLLWSTFLFSNNGIYTQQIEFPTGTTQLTNLVIKQASDIYNKLYEKNFTKIRITGDGEENWSRYDVIQLAKKRSRSIRDFFIGIGCKSKNVKIDYNGIPKIILFKPKAEFSVSGKIDLTSIEQQCFVITGNNKQHFKTKYGNVFVFEPQTFVDEIGLSPKGDISLCLWEFANKKDFIKGALSSGGKSEVLETASTFYIQVYSGDKKLGISNHRKFQVYIKRPRDGANYKPYYGNVRKGNIEWTLGSKSNACTSMFDEGEIYKDNEKVKNNQYEKTELEEYLLLKYKQIGWVNCDRVVNVRNPSVLKLVLYNTREEFTTRLVLKKRNVIVPGMLNSNYTNQYHFNKVPVGEPAYVFAFLKKGNGFLVAYSEVTLGYIKSINLKPEYKTESEFNALLDSFLQ